MKMKGTMRIHRSGIALVIVISLELLIFATGLWPGEVQAQEIEEEGSLRISVAPSALPADGKTYPTLFVQLLGPEGAPRHSREPLRVFLTSSSPEVATVPQEIIVEPDSSYASVPLSVSFLPGVTRVMALAADHGSASAEVKTVSPLGAEPPFRLEISALPPLLYADGTGVLTVTLVGANGTLYPAPSDVSVILTSADPGLLELPESLVIPRASYMVKTDWKALKPGNASMVAQADGLDAGNAQVEISEPAEDATPVYLEAYTMLPSLPALTKDEDAVLIQALNAERRPVPFPCVEVFLTSSSPRVVSVASTTSSPCDSPSPYVTYGVRTTATPGDATLTAGAAGLIPATLNVSTHGLRESRIELQYSPPVPTAVDSSPATLSVQLVDDDGNPVLYHKDYKVTLLGSGVDISNEVIIPSGESFALVPIGREFISDEARISAVASGVEGMSIGFAVGSGALEVSLDAVTLADGSGTEVTARVTSGGVPVASAEVVWDAEGLLSQSRFALTDDDGIARAILSPQTTFAPIVVTAQASYPGYDTAVATTTKSPAIPGGAADGGPSRLPFLLMFAGALAALVGYVVYNSGLYKKRPRLATLRGFSKS